MTRIAILGLCAVPFLTAPAFAQTCSQLWTERNAIYKDAGYCFKTNRAIRTFGNAGCSFDDIADVPLSARDRARVADIQRDERDMGCR